MGTSHETREQIVRERDVNDQKPGDRKKRIPVAFYGFTRELAEGSLSTI